MPKLISLENASELILKNINPLSHETINLENALNRTLSMDVTAPFDFPPFNRSAVDGFALRSSDIVNASSENPVRLNIIDEIQAGIASDKIININQAIKLTTGTPLPEGANTVVKSEDVIEGLHYIDIIKPENSYSNFCQIGADIKKDQLILAKGTVLTPASLGVLVGLGINQVTVYKIPKISVISTGSELVSITSPLSPAKIYNSNLYTLSSLIRKLGGKTVSIGIVEDCSDKIAEKIESQLEQSQMVVTTGGVSGGPFDLIQEALIKLDADILFSRVNLRGTPILAANKDGKLILCLSGNPGASFNNFQLLGVPAIKKLLGRKDYQLSYFKGVINENYYKENNQRRQLRGFGYLDNGVFKINLTKNQKKPGIDQSILNCNVLIDIPAQTQTFKKGDLVDFIFIA